MAAWERAALLPACLLTAAFLSLGGCNRGSGSDIQERFQQIRFDYLQGSDLDRSRQDADRAYRQYASSDPGWAWRFRLLEADIQLNQGLSIEVLQGLRGDPPPGLGSDDLWVRKRMLEAAAYSHTGDLASADRAFSDAGQRCPAETCEAFGELARIGGMLRFERNDEAGAQLFYRNSLEFARNHGDSFLEVSDLLNLGLVAAQQARFDEAVDWLGRSQQIAHHIRSYLDEEKAVGNLGWAYYRLGNFDRSLDLSRQAIHLARSLNVGIDELEWLNNVELVFLAEGKLDNAVEYYKTSLGLARKNENRRQELDALSSLAYSSLRVGQLDQAAAYIEGALRLAQQSGDASAGLYPRLLRGELLVKRGDLTTAEQVVSEVASHSIKDASLKWEAERSLAGIYLLEQRPGQADVEYREALNTISTARCDISHEELRMPFLANATHVYDEYVGFLVDQGRVGDALKVADQSRALTLAEGLGVEGKKCLAAEDGNFDPMRIARRSQATILFYWLGRKQSYLWAADSAHISLFPLPPEATLAPAIDSYRKALLGARDVLQSGDANGEELYRTLVAPAAEFFHPAGRVIVISDGILSGINFETLIVPQPAPHYWIEDATVENASSLRLLASGSASRVARPPMKLLLMGNPMPTPGFPELSHAVEETRNIGALFNSSAVELYDREKATTAAYLQGHAERFEYVHFVAHGTASETSPLDSAVVLSPAADGASKLYARDIITRPLQARLVTIAACKGAGTSWVGEGLVGLSWAFLHAGAHNVIGALWDVDDTSTPRLMNDMYTQLAQGSTPDAALRTAKLTLLHSEVAAFHKPYYWAPFQLYAGH